MMASWEAHFLNLLRENWPGDETKAVAFKIITAPNSDGPLELWTTALVRFADGRGRCKQWQNIATHDDAWNKIQEWVVFELIGGRTAS